MCNISCFTARDVEMYTTWNLNKLRCSWALMSSMQASPPNHGLTLGKIIPSPHIATRSCTTATPAGPGTGTVLNRSPAQYEQGQSPEPRIREYFYYIDHQGQLFLDDAKVKNFITCFKDKKFLAFFFKRLKINNFNHYKEYFPYLSPCGVERNFVRCDDRPIVFTHIIPDPENLESPGLLSCNFTGDVVTVKFEPEKVCMLPVSGRIYHPAPHKTGGVGLIKSSIAIEISPYFEFGEKGEYAPPTHFSWHGRRYDLTNEVLDLMTDSEKSELEGS